jgi:chromosome partitioning protein
MGMAPGEADPDQAEQPGVATETDAAHSSAGGTDWFSVDPSPEGFEGSDDDRHAPGPTGSREAGRDPLIDRHTAPPGPDLIYAGMVHVDPEPGIDSPAGLDRPKIPAGDGPDPRPPAPEDRPVGSDPSGEPATEGGVGVGIRRGPAAAGPEMAGRSDGRPGDPPGPTTARGAARAEGGPVDGGTGQGWLAARRPGTTPGDSASETTGRGPERPEDSPVEGGNGQSWPPHGNADAERNRDWEAPGSPTSSGPPVGPTEAPPNPAMSEAPQRPGEPGHDPDGFSGQPQGRSASGTGLGAAAGAGDGPAVEAAPEVDGGTGLREPERDAEPVPWTEPALPMPWPPPGEARAGGENGGVPADAEPEQPPAPDPRWPRLFAVGAETAAARLERGGELQSDQRVAERGTPAADPARSGDPPSTSAAPPWHRHRPDGTGEDASTAVDAVPTRTLPEVPAGPRTDAVVGEHDGAGQGGAGPPHGHVAGAASTDAAAGQAGNVPAPATVGPAEIGQMASRPPTSASGAPSSAHANMAPAGLSNPSVSGETEGGGGVVNQRPENQSIEEDEAAIAVREAVSRAAAQAGVDVSRETLADTLVEPTTTTPPGAVVEALGDTPRIDSETAARNARVTFKIHTDGANGHGRILAVANQKGGVGKSTTAVNLGAYLALAGARVLVVDLDPQGNASTGLGLDHREIEPSIYDVLTGETPPATAIRATTVANLHVLPSTIDLAGAEVELVSAMSREGRLGRALDAIHHYYDTVLIDCPPSLGLLTVNALAAADELLIPIQCEYYALEGLGQLLRNVELVRANLNPELRIGGIVLTMYDGRTRLAEQVVAEVRKHFSELVYQTVVPRSVRLSEAPGYGLPIALYDPLSRGGIAYRDLAFELAERSGLLAPTGEGAS